MARKTAAEKIEAMLERIGELVADVEIDGKLKIEAALGAALVEFADNPEEVTYLAKDHGYDGDVNADFIAGVRFIGELVKDSYFDYDC